MGVGVRQVMKFSVKDVGGTANENLSPGDRLGHAQSEQTSQDGFSPFPLRPVSRVDSSQNPPR